MANPAPPRSANSARPSDLAASTPGQDVNKEEQAALDAFLATASAAPGPAPSSGEEAALAQAQSAASPAPEAAPAEQPGVGSQVLDAAGRVLDYGGGAIRTGIAAGAGAVQSAVTGQPNVIGTEDFAAAAKGKAPSSADYLKRLGVSEGGSFKVPGTEQRVTLRGAEGLALDIATDPLTAVAKLIKEAPYIGKLINSGGAASQALGEAVYKSALALDAEGKAAVGSALIEAGAPVGGAAKLAKSVDDISSTMGNIRQGLYDKATEKGVLIDTAYPMKRAEAVISKMQKNPGLRPAAEELMSLLDRYKAEGKVPIDIMSEWKTALYDTLPASAFNGQGKLKGIANTFKEALAADFRDTIVKAGNAAEDGLGSSIDKLNEKWGALLSATRPLDKAAQATGGKLGHIIDGAVLATGGLHGAAVKKGYDIATSPFAKTVVGKALMEAGKAGLVDAVARRQLIDSQRRK